MKVGVLLEYCRMLFYLKPPLVQSEHATVKQDTDRQ